MERNRKHILLAGATLALSLAPGAMAQDHAGAQGDDLDIIVTARRVEERLQDVPISVTVFNQEQLSARNIVSTSDLAAYTPSLTANTRYGPDKATFAIRGFTQEGPTSPSVGVYFADVVAPRVNGSTPGGNGAGAGTLFDLQNVQVLKGPQGTLFGRNTTGGAILLVPRKPTSDFEGYLEASLGSYDLLRLQGVVNVPLAESVRLRLGVDRNTRRGYLRNRSGVGPRDFNDINYTAARASLVVDVTPELENYTIFHLTDSNTHGNIARLISCVREPTARVGRQPLTAQGGCDQIDRQIARGDGYLDVENSAPNARTKVEQWQAINTTTWMANDWLTVKNIASYSEYRELTTANLNGDNAFVPASLVLNRGGSFINVPTGSAAGANYWFTSFTPQNGHYTSSQRTFTEELQFQGSAFSGGMNWQVGGYLEISDPIGFSGTGSAVTLSCTDIAAMRCTDVLGSINNSRIGALQLVQNATWYRNYGLYAQGTYDLSDSLSATGGIRYTIDRTRGTGRNISVFFPALDTPVGTCRDSVHYPGVITMDPADCAYTARQNSKRPTWVLGLDYKPMSDLMVYAKYSRGYRQGNVNTAIPGFETFGPEKVDTYEVGTKASFTGAVRGYLNLAAFYNEFSDQQIQASAQPRLGTGLPGANILVNAGKSRIQGMEADFSISPLSGLRFDGGYAYLDTKLLSINAPQPPASSPYATIISTVSAGSALTLAPKHRVTVTGAYTLPLDREIGEVTLSATFTHTSRQLLSQTNINAFLEPLSLLNMNINWADVGGSPIDIALFATNVTKKKYTTFINGAAASVGYESANVGEPRMLGVRLRARFGE